MRQILSSPRWRTPSYAPNVTLIPTNFDIQEAFESGPSQAICPYCGHEQFVPKNARFITIKTQSFRSGTFKVYTCGFDKVSREAKEGCGLRFMFGEYKR